VKWKAQFDKTSSELAALKKQHKAALSDEERKEAERAEREAAMQAELETLRKASEVTTMKAKYLALGYDEKLAESTAQAFSDGDTDTVFANQKAHIESVEKAAASKALDDTHKPRGGSGRQPDANSLVPDKNMTVQQTIDKKAAFLAEPQA
jgi:hypothetical protein